MEVSELFTHLFSVMLGPPGPADYGFEGGGSGFFGPIIFFVIKIALFLGSVFGVIFIKELRPICIGILITYAIAYGFIDLEDRRIKEITIGSYLICAIWAAINWQKYKQEEEIHLAEVRAKHEAKAQAKREVEAEAQEAKARREAEAKAQREAKAKAQREAEAKAEREPLPKAKSELVVTVQREEEAIAKLKEARAILKAKREEEANQATSTHKLDKQNQATEKKHSLTDEELEVAYRERMAKETREERLAREKRIEELMKKYS